MNLLVLGNSHAACMKIAHDRDPHILGSLCDVAFYVMPGGGGPSMIIEDDLTLRPVGADEKWPPYWAPSNTPERPISSYDVIVLSALAFIDGGFSYPSPALQQGLLHEFGPKAGPPSANLVSKEVLGAVLDGWMENLPGVLLLGNLRQKTSSRIIVQPFPLFSVEMKLRDDWILRSMYQRADEMHAFVVRHRQAYLEKLCERLSVELLPYPDQKWLEDGFTPQDLMAGGDLHHGNAEYGRLVLEQIAEAIQEASSSLAIAEGA